MALGFGALESIVKLLQRQIADAQDAQKIVFLHIDQSKIARQYLDIAEPEAVFAIFGRKYKIIRQRRPVTEARMERSEIREQM